jgi:poly(3-hydroxybutyrate) depolymerase
MASSGRARKRTLIVVIVALAVLSQATAVSMAAPSAVGTDLGAPATAGSMPDGIYVGDTRTDDNLISYRLQVTIADHTITAADFRERWDGFPFNATYIEQSMIDPVRRPVYDANEPTFIAQAAAAQAYDSQLVGLTDPDQIPVPASNVAVYDALLEAWASLVTTRLKIVQHVNQAVGDNGNAPHTWNEYLPRSVQDAPGHRVPLVLVLHGSNNSIVHAEGLGFPFLGAKENFISLVPDTSNNGNTYGPDGSWNVTPAPDSTRLSDVDFLLALIRYEEQSRAIDPTRIYLTGISNGAAMSSYLAMLHPHMFAGVGAMAGCVACTGGSLNEAFVSQVNALLARDPAPGLPVVTGLGDEDPSWLSPLRNQGPFSTAGPGYRNQISWWKAYNGIPQVTWDPQYPWGQPLEGEHTIARYSFAIDTGELRTPDGLPLLSFYTVHQMFHDPSPYGEVLMWNFLRRFHRLPDGHISGAPQ